MNDFQYLQTASGTDVGRIRERNEDAIFSSPAHGFFCVADGVGGGEAGHVASAAMVDALEKLFEDFTADPSIASSTSGKSRLLRRTTNQVSQWIRGEAVANGFRSTGTTVVMMLFDVDDPGKAIGLHAGDSCIYRLRNGELEQVTRNHSYAEISGIDPAHLPPHMKGVITRAVGVSEEVDLEETEIDVASEDLFLICSDGLYGMISDHHMVEIVSHANSVDDGVRNLIHAANAAGGRDNISVILVRANELPGRADLEDADDDEPDFSETQDLSFPESGD